MPDFLQEQLTKRLQGVISQQYRELKFHAGKLFATIPDLTEGDEEVVRETLSEVGQAQLLAEGSWDIAPVDTSADEDRYPTFMIAAAFSLSYKQERAIRGAKRKTYDPIQQKQRTAIRASAEKHNSFAAYGSTVVSQTGFCNNANVTLDNNSTDFSSITAQQMITFFFDQIKSAYTSSTNNSTSMPNLIAISEGMAFKLADTKVPDGDKPILVYIREGLREMGIDIRFEMCRELNSAQLEAAGVQSGGTNKDRVVIYNNDPENIERHVELPFLAPVDWQLKQGGRTNYPVFSFTTPTMINRPHTMRYVDVPKL